MHGVEMKCIITSDEPHDISNVQFMDEFIEWIEQKGYSCCGAFSDYVYDHVRS